MSVVASAASERSLLVFGVALWPNRPPRENEEGNPGKGSEALRLACPACGGRSAPIFKAPAPLWGALPASDP